MRILAVLLVACGTPETKTDEIDGIEEIGESSPHTSKREVAGPSDAEAVKEVVQRYKGQLQYCYESRLKVDPTLEGRIEVGWTLQNGRVSQVQADDEIGDPELARCIEKKIARWKFPEHLEGDVSWPFVFHPKDSAQ